MAKSVSELAYFDEQGFHLADFEDFLTFNRDAFARIYGTDVYLDPDSQDAQLITHFAQAQYDLASLCAAVFNAYSPHTAAGESLSRQVKINGIQRRAATKSLVDLLITGRVGTGIYNGRVRDTLGQMWILPSPITIPTEGRITVTAAAENAGAVKAAPDTITKIATPTDGWISVTNPAEATPGTEVETDAALRIRQADSTAEPSQAIIRGLAGEIANLQGVTRLRVYENDHSEPDANGIPGHTISAVVEGGDAVQIAEAIRRRKTTGTGTYGTTNIDLTDPASMPIRINFFRPTTVHVKVHVTLKPLAGYSSTYATELQDQVVAYINSLGIGSTVYLSKLYVPANLDQNAHDDTYDIESIELAADDGTPAAANIKTAFNAVPYCEASYVTVTVNEAQ